MSKPRVIRAVTGSHILDVYQPSPMSEYDAVFAAELAFYSRVTVRLKARIGQLRVWAEDTRNNGLANAHGLASQYDELADELQILLDDAEEET